MATKYSKTIGYLGFIVLFISYSLLAISKPLSQDEGVFLTIAKYLNHGLLPYGDFFDHKPPAIYFLFSLLFKITGPNLLLAKSLLIVTVLLSAVTVYKIGEIYKKSTGILAAILFLYLMIFFEGYFLIAEPFLILPLLLSLYFFMSRRDNWLWMMAVGVLTAIVILFKQTAIISVIPLFLLAYQTKRKLNFLLFGLGFMVPLILVLIYFLSHSLLPAAFDQIIRLNFTNYPRENFGLVIQSLKSNFLWTLPVWALLIVSFRHRDPEYSRRGTKGNLPLHGLEDLSPTVSEHLGATWLEITTILLSKPNTFLFLLILLPLPFMFFRHYPHYWVQIIPFVAIGAATKIANFEATPGELKHTPGELLFSKLAILLTLYCLISAGLKTILDVPNNFGQLRQQLELAQTLKNQDFSHVLAENQFSGFYFLLDRKPLNKYLYITEIDDIAQETSINDLKHNKALILWPSDPNYAYAKNLQEMIKKNNRAILENNILDLTVYENYP